MKIKNHSNHPKIVAGTRVEPGDEAELENVSADELPRHVEEVEESGDSGSDQNTKTEKSESDEDQGGEE